MFFGRSGPLCHGISGLFLDVSHRFVELLSVRTAACHRIRPQRLLKFRGGLVTHPFYLMGKSSPAMGTEAKNVYFMTIFEGRPESRGEHPHSFHQMEIYRPC
jgi:hypothetical protein